MYEIVYKDGLFESIKVVENSDAPEICSILTELVKDLYNV